MKFNMINKFRAISVIFLTFLLISCSGVKLPGGDARENPADPKQRVKKNLEEGKGFRLDTAFKKSTGTNFEFASSNELWRASLDVIEFMPLTSANYSGGIIITDWFSEDQNESIKLTIRFLSNEIRSDAINVKVFYKKCDSGINCKIEDVKGELEKEIKKKILNQAAIYKKQTQDKNFKPYNNTDYQ